MGELEGGKGASVLDCVTGVPLFLWHDGFFST